MKKLFFISIFVLMVLGTTGCSLKDNQAKQKEPDITQIRSICNLATLECYYHNVAKSTKEAGSGLTHVWEKERKFWIEYTGTAKIGIDMSKVDIKIQKEKNLVTVFLPEAKLLSIDINENDLDEESYIASADGTNSNKITASDQTSAIQNAQLKMAEDVKNNSQLLVNAQSRAKDLIENYITKLGDLSGKQYTIEWIYEEKSNEKVE